MKRVAYHVHWSLPKSGYLPNRFEVVLMIISALSLKRLGYFVRLYTDTEFYTKYSEILGIYDEINTEILDKESKYPRINARVYWAAGKIVVLPFVELGALHCDTDLILHRDVTKYDNIDLFIGHDEPSWNKYYPDKKYLETKVKELPSWYREDIRPFNMSLYSIHSNEFKKKYIEAFYSYAENVAEGNVFDLLFAEQVSVACLAKADNIKVHMLGSLDETYDLGFQNHFTHIWGGKTTLREDKQKEAQFLMFIEGTLSRLDYGLYTKVVKCLDNIYS